MGKLTIFGGGFAAAHLARFASSLGFEVVIYVSEVCDVSSARVVRFSVPDLLELLHDDGSGCVINCLTIPGGAIGHREYFAMCDDLLSATKSYYQYAPEGFKYVAVAPYSIYGSLESDVGSFDERSCCAPNSVAAAAFAAAIMLTMSYRFDLPVTTVVHSTVYGLGQDPSENIISYALDRILSRKFILLSGSGRHVRDFLYIKDFCEGMMRIVTSGIGGECYCLGSGEGVDILSAISGICNVVNDTRGCIDFCSKTLIKFGGGGARHDRRRVLSGAKAQRDVHFRRSHSLAQGFMDLVADGMVAGMFGLDFAGKLDG